MPKAADAAAAAEAPTSVEHVEAAAVEGPHGPDWNKLIGAAWVALSCRDVAECGENHGCEADVVIYH